jgi:ketosteroid isomerase-like protein
VDPQRGETVRRLLDIWGQGQWDPAIMTDDYAMEQHGGTMQGVYRGEEGMRDYAEGFQDAWAEASVYLDDLFEHDGMMVAMTRLKVRGRSSGIEVEIAGAGVLRFAEDGRARRLDAYTDRDAALESVGLPAA